MTNARQRSDPSTRYVQQPMTKIESLEHQIRGLSPEELAEFRRWFAAFDAAVWDAELEVDAAAGKLDAVADEAIAQHRAGRSRKL